MLIRSPFLENENDFQIGVDGLTKTVFSFNKNLPYPIEKMDRRRPPQSSQTEPISVALESRSPLPGRLRRLDFRDGPPGSVIAQKADPPGTAKALARALGLHLAPMI